MPNTKILLAEDDTIIASGLLYAFEGEGYSSKQATDVATALQLIKTEKFSLAVLDMQLPDGTGFDIYEKIKNEIPVIFLTVVNDEGNIVRALEGGAEDYITKPFRLRELLARIKAVLRRHGNSDLKETNTLGNITVNIEEGNAYIGNKALELTALEYRLLLIFVMNKGKILSRIQILDRLWDSAGNFVEDNTLTVYIKRLRDKIGNNANIETVRGLGYRASDSI